ncbi:MAG: WbqC family protein [Bacteroidales bacterium]|nr:WbqC family protein [Bacteroidales bacterium]MDD3890858.1 WbqC family protein [Bacteroidales bacterium]
MQNNPSILSIAYLPSIRYVKQLLSCKTVYLEKHETYKKQTYRNRCVIYSANGALPLSIPVIKPQGNRTKVCDVVLDNSVKWRKEHWRAIESAYKNSAYFEYLKDYFEQYYVKEWKYLWDFNLSILETIMTILEIKVELKETELYIKEYDNSFTDMRRLADENKKEMLNNTQDDKYFQVFENKHAFIPNLSVFDLLCNCGMDSRIILMKKGD